MKIPIYLVDNVIFRVPSINSFEFTFVPNYIMSFEQVYETLDIWNLLEVNGASWNAISILRFDNRFNAFMRERRLKIVDVRRICTVGLM